MFTTSVANIGPNEEIVVAHRIPGDAALRRRHVPPALSAGDHAALHPGRATRDAATASGWSPADAAGARRRPHHAARRESARRLRQSGDDRSRPRTPAFRSPSVASTYHAMHVEERPGNRYRLTLGDGPVPAARDFELVVDAGRRQRARRRALHRDQGRQDLRAADGAAAVARRKPTAPRAPREITYIIDTSGSMEGVSIAQARDALLLALDRLQPGDRFNVIEFNSDHARRCSARPMPVDAATLAQGRGSSSAALRAPGGTEMLPALQRGARRRARVDDDAPGRVPHRRRRRQRGRDPEARARAARRPAPVHRSASAPRPTRSS